jgi:hypothetical protein
MSVQVLSDAERNLAILKRKRSATKELNPSQQLA